MKLTPEASMRMRASPGPGVGVGRSRRVRTSAEPVVRIWMACMWMPEYNNWCADWGWFIDPFEAKTTADSSASLRNDKTKEHQQKQGQSRSPFRDDKQE